MPIASSDAGVTEGERDRPSLRHWRRIGEVGIAGLARRARSRLARGADARTRARWRERFVRSDAEPVLSDALGATPQADLAAAVAAALAPARTPFFFDGSDPALARAFATRHPAALDAILREADATLAGDWSWIAPGGRADWNAALPGTGRWPAVDPDVGAARPLGDVRLNWELTRGTQLVRVAQAAWATGAPHHAEGLVAAIDDFARTNPPGTGVAWEHAQETALRGVALLWCFHLVRRFPAFDARAARTWLWLVLAHGEHAAAHLSNDAITHNHLVSEAAGLAVLGMALPALAPAARWKRIGTQLLWRELRKQVDDEGVHAEYSSHYHGFVLDSLLATLLLGAQAGVAVPARARESIGRMADHVAWLLLPDGRLPAIGDTDAGRAFRLAGDPLDRRDVLAAAAVAFDRPDWGAIAGDAPGAFFLTGGRAVPGAASGPPGARARRFDDAGLGVARTGYGPDAELLVFRAGPTRFRPDVQLSHLHADALSVVWRIGADDVLIDPGTYLYSESDGWRARLRGTAAHSCVVVDGRDQADVTTARFGISGQQPARWLAFEAGATALGAAAEHPAGGAIRVRRRLAWIAGHGLALCDDVLGEGTHRVESWLQLPATTGDASGCAALLALASGRRIRVQGFGDATKLAVVRPSGAVAPGPGWLAPRYGTLAPGTALHIDAGARPLPARIVTLLLVAPPGAEPAVGHLVETGSARVVLEAGDVRFELAAPA